MIVIHNCFHWIGYHLIQKFLEEGYEVTGCDSIQSEKKENLHMFVGRNSHFEFVDTLPENRIADNDVIYIDVQSNLLSIQNQQNDTHTINIPMLFGPFMDRDKDGFYEKENYISFDSETFQEEAIWIDDYMEVLWSILMDNPSSKDWVVKPFSKSVRQEEDEDNVLYIRQTEPTANRLKQLEEHYQTFANIY
ncbi:hypothetical protein [Radiobacillus deserti]|uniref:NAD(P)-dependent oxidoreductase n=1 Tax=Radiobacillus deserti TaxID=2594883 RepID=A0A516KEE1_9BACI|nr:hypothetical protein [Radiobacillus deserti]QDP39781.1 hypothetical protein FN924_06105 [Radiobacillus deserti]